jgi:hypothetical protein
MYKLLNKLFRWDYVLVKYGYDWLLRRVHVDAYGETFVRIYGDVEFLSQRKVVYLTFKAEKYKIEKAK